MNLPELDNEYLVDILTTLLNTPSPTGYTDQVVHLVGEELHKFKIPFTITRRGAIRATVEGIEKNAAKAVATHLDTLGAMAQRLKDNGRLAISPVGTWPSRFAEGARVTIFKENGSFCRGTVLPLESSGHVYGNSLDKQVSSWDNLEVRIDDKVHNQKEIIAQGFNIGDFIAFDTSPELTQNGFLNARHLDDKAGVAIALASMKWLRDYKVELPVSCHFLFTIAEEVGLGASAVMFEDVAEMVVIDNATVDKTQNSKEYGVTICMKDHAGPFDYHLTRRLIQYCKENGLDFCRDIFQHYRSDSASAIVAGHDTRTALIGFGVDSSHGYERTHLSSLLAVGKLLGLYLQGNLVFNRDKEQLSSLNGFPHQQEREIIQIHT